MTNFKRMDIVCIAKLHRIPRKRIGMYHVDTGVVFNSIQFPSRKLYYVQYSNKDINAKGRTWLNEKYVFKNFDEAQKCVSKLNEKLQINRSARKKVKKLYED